MVEAWTRGQQFRVGLVALEVLDEGELPADEVLRTPGDVGEHDGDVAPGGDLPVEQQGRRTQNLAGRQLTLIEDLERNERDPEMLARLYRLDHVATRLRRSADSLLVVSGTIDQLMSGGPTHLADVIRSALGEIEGFQTIEIGEISDVAVSAGLVADLRLLLAELLENATNFSPPGTPVTRLGLGRSARS